MLRKIFLTLFTICAIALSVKAQEPVDIASTHFKRFVALNNDDGAHKDSLYTALRGCYTNTVAAISLNSSDTKAKNMMQDIYPYLQNGAIYYSQVKEQASALFFAQSYVDATLMPVLSDLNLVKNEYYPTMVYFAASGTFNAKDYERAITYFKEYLQTGELKNKLVVSTYLAKACQNIGDEELAKVVLEQAIKSYPTDFNLLSMAINACIDTKDNSNLQKYLASALAIKPEDLTLLNIQGKLYEDNYDFQSALSVYTTLRNNNPESLDVAKHLALNYYNLGVQYNNKGITEKDTTASARIILEANDYFLQASLAINEILSSDPTSLKYTEALAVCYSSMGRNDDLATINQRIISLGGYPIAPSSIPTLIAYDSKAGIAQGSTEEGYMQLKPGEKPIFSEYAKSFVEYSINKWQVKDSYETLQEYQARVTEAKREQKIKELLKQAEQDYVQMYAQNIKLDKINLKPYDADNQSFLLETDYGQVIVPVPRSNDEAKVFERNWKNIKYTDASYYIKNDQLTIAGLTLTTPAGNTYRYDNKEALTYTETIVDINFNAIESGYYATSDKSATGSNVSSKSISMGKSDVDMNIPEIELENSKTFAVIIANENYQAVTKVPMALNDGYAFSTYCEKTLGLPKNNIRSYYDATYGAMLRAIRDVKDISEALSGDIKVIFYYAGHGIPDENSKSAYLLPVDSDGKQTESCYSLDKLYAELGELKAENVCVFLDACFSGAKRDGGTVSESSRGVAIKAKASTPKGNMIVFSAASDDETALPYSEKEHGLFTYYLLKKLQESEGSVTLGELGSYIQKEVKAQSIVINRKLQSPNVTPSASISSSWSEMTLR